MSQTISFIYCSILLIVYTSVLSFACCLYLVHRQAVFIPAIGLFAFFLLDTLVIFMTEQLTLFSKWYDQSFLASPAIKSVIFIGIGYFTLLAWNVITKRKFSLLQGILLILVALWLFFIPLMDRGPLEVWLYFLGYQIFMIATAAYALWKLRDFDHLDDAVPLKIFRWLLICIIVLAFFIIGEDTFVIFTLDNYAVDYLNIFCRSISEDVLRLTFTVFMFIIFSKHFQPMPAQHEPLPADTQAESPEDADTAAKANAALDYKRLKFSRHIGLTERETEVFILILDDLNYQQIGETLHISQGTVKAHIHNIFQKAEVSHRYELLRQFDSFSSGHSLDSSSPE